MTTKVNREGEPSRWVHKLNHTGQEPRTEAWVKKEVKKIFAEFGCSDPWMPSASIYGRKGGADFIECIYAHYIAIETKKLGNKPTKLQEEFGAGVRSRGGFYLVIYENNLHELHMLLSDLRYRYVVQVPKS